MRNARTTVEGWLNAFEALDVERILAPLADDVDMRVESMTQQLPGKEALRPLVAGFTDACESVRIQREKIIESGRDVAVLAQVTAKMKSDIEIAGETLPVSGKELTTLAAIFVSVSDSGDITHVVRIRDSLEMVRQLDIPLERMRSLLEKVQQGWG